MTVHALAFPTPARREIETARDEEWDVRVFCRGGGYFNIDERIESLESARLTHSSNHRPGVCRPRVKSFVSRRETEHEEFQNVKRTRTLSDASSLRVRCIDYALFRRFGAADTPADGVVIPPRARPVGRPDVGYSESCVMASEDSGAVDGGVGAFSSDAVASLSASVEGLQLSRRRPDFTLPPMHPGLRLSSSAPLVAASEAGGGERVFCDRCRSNRRFFCHACLVPLVDDVPVVRLPFRAYFITDEKEKRSKATGAQCAILAPSQVTLCRPDHLPPLDPRRTVLLFPEKGAMSVEDVVAALAPRRSSDERRRSRGPEDAAARLSALDAVVIIDSKWDGATLISKSETLRNLPRAMLARHRTAFWRFHPQPKSQRKRDDAASLRAAGEDDGDERLCSLEALYFFAREFHEGGG